MAKARKVGHQELPQSQPQTGLRFKTQQNYMHHLFKLGVAMFKRNVAFPGAPAEYVDNEHVHWFHSITSDGKEQTRTNSVGGHFHIMEFVPAKVEGEPPVAICKSGPMREVVQIINGRRSKVPVPVNDVDQHTHEVTYEMSNVIVERQRNVEAAKAEAEIAARFNKQAPSGIATGADE